MSSINRATVCAEVTCADRPAAEACCRAGVGASLTLKVGATVDPETSQPVEVPAKVIFLSPTSDLPERQAVVEVKGISLVLTARRRPFHEIKDFTSLGLDPTSFKIVVVKAGYLVPPIAKIANPNLMALTPGAVNQDIVHLPTNKYRIRRRRLVKTYCSSRCDSCGECAETIVSTTRTGDLRRLRRAWFRSARRASISARGVHRGSRKSGRAIQP